MIDKATDRNVAKTTGSCDALMLFLACIEGSNQFTVGDAVDRGNHTGKNQGPRMEKIKHPYYPIIYVRGYAMTQGEIDETSSTPYMGFNLGATKVRQNWDGKVRRHIFESPLIRLMKDYGYCDVYQHGHEIAGRLKPKSIVIYRYYEAADSDLGDRKALTIPEAAKGLNDLVLKLRDQVCGDDADSRVAFKVYLVAHSMGGLVCRAMLQNEEYGSAEARGLVDKVFTYATPHNGIEMLGANVPSFLKLWDVNNFNRGKIAKYLGFDGEPERVDSLNGKFDSQRFFCLVGTNHEDYTVAAGLSSKLAGEMSDGLVRISNATVQGAPRAFVHRSHSGPFGIVNSEDGFQNLTRFLFGTHRVDGFLEVEKLPLPKSIQDAYDKEKNIRGSYYFEATLAPRGAITYTMTQRRKETFSAVLRQFDDLMRSDKPRSPYLFTAYLDTAKITTGGQLVFSIDVAVSSTEFEIDRFLVFDKTIPGENLFRNNIVIRITLGTAGPVVRYIFSDDSWGESRGTDIKSDAQGMYIPLKSGKGFQAKLRFKVAPWNQ